MSSRVIRYRDANSAPTLTGVVQDYDPFDLNFLVKKSGKIFNDTFDVTDAPLKLIGVPTGRETIKLSDYLVYRPVPKELLAWRNVPAYHPDSLDMELWYQDLITYADEGVWVDGEYWNPFMVYWLNIFVFPVYKLDGNGNPLEDFEPTHPYYCNIDRYILDVAWKAEIKRSDVSIMGGRGIGKSYLWGSILDREYRLKPGSWCIVSSTGEEETNEAWNKIEECLDVIEKKHRGLKHKRQGGDSGEFKYASEKFELSDGTIEYRGYLSKIEKIIYGRKPGKTRGKRPTKQLVEEFAAFPPSGSMGNLRSCIRESKGSWFVGGSIKKCTVLYSGTGGTVANDEAEGIFTNPKAHNIEPTYDWPEAGAKGCGIFIPTHIKRSGTWEKTGCPDILSARILVEEERFAAKDDPQSFIGLLQEFPMNLKEVFMRSGANIFNQEKIASQRAELKFNQELPKPGRGFLKFIRSESGRIIDVEWDPNPAGDIDILEHPHWILERNKGELGRPEEKEPISDLYISGLDSIDQGSSDSAYATNDILGSKLAMVVKKRILDKAYTRSSNNVYVAKYVKRSQNVMDDYKNVLKLAIYYCSKVNLEYTKISIVAYFRDEGFYHLFTKRPTIALAGGDPKKHSNLIGTQASTPVIDHMDMKVKDYIDEYYDQIFFDDILEQCQDYNRDNRTKFDLVIAMGLCELGDEDLMGKPARSDRRESEDFRDIGYYTDSSGIKRYGVIPTMKSAGLSDMEELIKKEKERFSLSGGIRWIDMSDPINPRIMRGEENE